MNSRPLWRHHAERRRYEAGRPRSRGGAYTCRGLTCPQALGAESARLGLEFRPTRQYLDLLLAKFMPLTWVTLQKGTEPTAPVDGRVEVVVPVQVGGTRAGSHAKKCIVRAGAVLAKRLPGVAGRPGTDLLGREVPARPPLEPKLPQSINTEISDDGNELVSVCDGEAVLRNLAIEVIPMLLHEGDIPAGATFTSEVLPVHIRGSVLEGALVEATGEIFIEGDVVEAHVLSSTSHVTVAGRIPGRVRKPRNCARKSSSLPEGRRQ